MKTSDFLSALRAQPALELVFRSGGRLIAPGYHLTEVMRVAYDTMDCGSQSHRWTETQFEIWVPPLAGVLPGRGHMPGTKFLSIIDRVEATLPLDGEAPVRIHAAFDGQPASLFDVDSVTPAEGRLWVELTPDRTRCKAAERSLATATGGCCQPDRQESDRPLGAGCGCGLPDAKRENATCCA